MSQENQVYKKSDTCLGGLTTTYTCCLTDFAMKILT